MARAHEVAVGADGRDFERAIKQEVIKPTEEAARALDDLGDAGDDAGSEASRGLDKLEDALRDVQKQSEKTGTSIGRDIEKGTDKARRGLDDMKDEADSTAREAAASFQEPADALDAVQELAANAFSGFGPAGAAAGIAAAAGLGLVTAEIGKQQEATQKLKEFFADAYQSAAEEGRKFIDSQTILREANDIQFNKDRVDEYNRAVETSKYLNIDVNDVLLARAGDQKSLNIVLEATRRKEDDIKRAAEAAGSTAIRLSGVEQKELDKVQREYENIGRLHGENAKKAQNSQNIRDTLYQREREQINRTAAAAQSRYEGLAAQLGKPITKTVKFVPDTSSLVAAQRRAEAWARNGLRVAVTGTLSGRTWQ